MIPKRDLVIGKFYIGRGRNFNVAKWDGDAFIGLRTKFNETYEFPEYHWNDGPPFGTFKPYYEDVCIKLESFD